MIYFTGDTHGEVARFMGGNLRGEPTWTGEDYLIVCGDFGFVFTDSDQENLVLDYLAQKPYTICFCDGNHENFNRLEQYPQEQWNGGRIHRIRPNVIHLMRGQVFTIAGKRIFTMGGAYSIDKYRRIEGYSWWQQELPCAEEYREATRSLEACGKEVDYIVTHTAPLEIIHRMGYVPDGHDLELTRFLKQVKDEVRFQKWFFGHWHRDLEIDNKFRALWFDVAGETD